MKIERWEEESDEEWAVRLADEIALANNTEVSQYFVERDSYTDDGIIINYIGEDGWTWKEHPEGVFKAKQIIEWKNKAEKWGKLSEAMKKTVSEIREQTGAANISQIVIHHVLTAYLQAMGEEVQSSTPKANEK